MLKKLEEDSARVEAFQQLLAEVYGGMSRDQAQNKMVLQQTMQCLLYDSVWMPSKGGTYYQIIVNALKCLEKLNICKATSEENQSVETEQ